MPKPEHWESLVEEAIVDSDVLVVGGRPVILNHWRHTGVLDF